MTIVSVLVVLIGFGPTYYFKPLMTSPALPMLTHLHGAVFTAWLLLFGLQATLGETGQTFTDASGSSAASWLSP
jgi:hypothetical protein